MENRIFDNQDIFADLNEKFSIYPQSIQSYKNSDENSLFFMAEYSDENDLENLPLGKKKLMILTDDAANMSFNEFYGKVDKTSDTSSMIKSKYGLAIKICPLNHNNCSLLRKYFSFTAPVSHKKCNITIGLGDRLGLASPGHIRAIKNHKRDGIDIFPVLAQQSIRELNLTGRDYKQVLDAATIAVFQEGYEAGFGADGDHLKTAGEVRMALECGFTMITLDCSEHIDNKIAAASQKEIDEKYALLLDETKRNEYEEKYCSKTQYLKDGTAIDIKPQEFRKIALVYYNALKHAGDIYHNIISNCGREIDFEVSIDETLTPTSPEAHFFVGSELASDNISAVSVAPRFCGEFQKGIDYIGDIAQFEVEFRIHCRIADHFGYKVSVHSGSDKFSIFPIVGKHTGGRFHLKTAGTSWLEAVRVIAARMPDLYRRMQEFSLKHLDEARKYYHIGADPTKVYDAWKLTDAELPALMQQNDARQVMHITYGLLLLAADAEGRSIFKTDFYEAMGKYIREYTDGLALHIGRHLETLGL